MAGKKFWIANFPRKGDGTDASIDKNTAEGARDFLANADNWYDQEMRSSKAGVDTLSKVLKSETIMDDNNISAWRSNAFNIKFSNIERNLAGYPQSFWYTIQTDVATKTDADLGEVGNPLSIGLEHPFPNQSWDIYITKVIVITDSAQSNTTTPNYYSIGLASSPFTSHGDEISGTHGKFDTSLAAGSMQIITPNAIGNIAVSTPWTIEKRLGLKPTSEANAAGWKGKLYIECFCPQVYPSQLLEYVNDPAEGSIMKTFNRN